MRTVSMTGVLFAGAAGLVGAACSGSSGGEAASIVGTIHGRTFAVDNAISVVLGGTDPSAGIIMSDQPGLCDDLGSGKQPPNLTGGTITLSQLGNGGGSTTAPTGPGTFTVTNGQVQPTSPNLATFSAVYTDATCQDVSANEAGGMSGTVTLTSVNGNVFAGHFDVMLDSGDHVTGSFSPQACPALAAAIASATPPACI